MEFTVTPRNCSSGLWHLVLLPKISGPKLEKRKKLSVYMVVTYTCNRGKKDNTVDPHKSVNSFYLQFTCAPYACSGSQRPEEGVRFSPWNWGCRC